MPVESGWVRWGPVGYLVKPPIFPCARLIVGHFVIMACLDSEQLKIPSLELQRLYLDLTYCYKIVFGLVTLNMTDFLYKPRSDCTVRMNFFVNRVINAWNNRPTSVSFTSLPDFSRTIRSFDFRNFLKCNSC